MRAGRLTVAVSVVLLLVVIGAGAALVVGQGGGSDTPGNDGLQAVAPTGGPPATAPPKPSLARFYDQQLDWSDCDSGHQCAKLEVPLDYEHPGGRTIELALLQQPASGERLGSLVLNPGGPGEPGTTYAASAGQVFGAPLLQHYDIVGFDPRGTGDSSPVDCVGDAELTRYLSMDPEPGTSSELAGWRRNQLAMARGCAERSGALASHISTVESAQDMDVLRAALGERRLTYFGFSYGTELGAVFAQLFPDRVGRFVLDGAVDPALSSRQLDLQQARGFQQALEAYVASCVASDIGCFLGNTQEKALASIDTLMRRIDAKPLPAGNGRVLTLGTAFTGIAYPLYSRAAWLLLTSGLRAAFGGDGSQLLSLADTYAARNADGTYGNNSMEAFYAISCLDDPTSIPYRQVPAQYPAFEKASPLFGKAFAWSLAGCRGFAAHSDHPIPAIHARGAAPIVVIGTTRDPATPYRWAVSLARQLDSGVLVSRDGDGHTGYHQGNACVDHAVESYLVGGTVPRAGLSC